jgi:glycosyltransferase involved in cell wall biosynthesis
LFQNKIQEYGLEDNFIFKGQQQNVHEWLQATDILLFPSHEGAEGMGRVPFEAMATGTPVIASDISGVNEAVTEEVGILIEEKNSSALSDAISKLYEEKDYYDYLSKNGRKRALELFDINLHAVNMMNLFQEMVNEK